jgi:protein SCO1/2
MTIKNKTPQGKPRGIVFDKDGFIVKSPGQVPRYSSNKILYALVFLICVLPSHLILSKETLPNELKKVGIQEQLGNQVPLDIGLTDSQGNQVVLGDYFSNSKPVILNLVYYNCPMLCNLVVTGLTEGLNKTSLALGEKYKIVTLSIDPKDTVLYAKKYKEKYLNMLNQKDVAQDWSFLIGQDEAIKKVSESVGFGFRYNDETKQFAHSAAIFILTPEGKVARYLYGIEYKPFDLKMGLLEASKGKQISTVERVLLFCYNYDPNSKGYVLYARNVMRVGGILTLLFIGSLWFWAVKSKKKSEEINE